MTDLELNRAIRAVVALAAGIPAANVRPANQDAPASGDMYATVLIPNTSKTGWDDSTYANVPDDPDQKVRQTVEGQRVAMASVQFFREGGRDAANKLETRIQMAEVLALMRSLSIGFVSISPIRNLSAVVNSAWEHRAQIDMFFSYTRAETADVATFGTFPISVQTLPVQANPPVIQTKEVIAP